MSFVVSSLIAIIIFYIYHFNRYYASINLNTTWGTLVFTRCYAQRENPGISGAVSARYPEADMSGINPARGEDFSYRLLLSAILHCHCNIDDIRVFIKS